jgi:hypothetical protein
VYAIRRKRSSPTRLDKEGMTMQASKLIRRAAVGLAAMATAFAATTGAGHAAATVGTNCVWDPGSGGCSFVTQATPGAGIWVVWQGGAAAPTVNGNDPFFCFVNSGGGLCSYQVLTTPGDTITVVADPASAGVATEQDSL